jgi:glucose-1-phosphatase
MRQPPNAPILNIPVFLPTNDNKLLTNPIPPMTSVKNILFDLGGVFMNLDFSLTEKAFIALGVTQFPAMFNQHHSNDLFEQLETGKIDEPTFFSAFRKESGLDQLTDDQIRTAWNALLLDFPPERLTWLAEIRTKYNIYLYSNTNRFHYEAFMKILQKENGIHDFDGFFRKAWYSHEVGLRKPYPESFRQILQLENLHPAETLFIDDTLKNILGAREAGLQTHHLVAPETVLDLGL